MAKRNDLEEVLNRAYALDQKEADREFAHLFKAHKASMRILVGAFNSGDLAEDQFINVAKALRDKMGHAGIVIDVDSYIRKSIPFRKKLKSRPKNELTKLLSELGKKVLLIDDEYESVGWKFLFDAILRENVLYAASKEEALGNLGNLSIGAVLLDLKLPSDPEDGIALLNEIKGKRLDLPVVIFTGEDTIKYQRKCFAEGAFDYFVKEFEEADKNYLGYYQTLKEILLTALQQSKAGEVWREILNLESDIRSAGPPYFEDVIHYLRKAYYFLTMREDSWSVRTILSRHDITHYAEVIIQSALGIETLMDKLINDRRNDPIVKLFLDKESVETITMGKKLNILRSMKILDKNIEEEIEDIFKLRNDCVHPKRGGLTISEKRAINILEAATHTVRGIIFSDSLLAFHLTKEETHPTKEEEIKKFISDFVPAKPGEIAVQMGEPIKVKIYSQTPGKVIGKKGSVIFSLSEEIESRFGRAKIDVISKT